MCLNNNNIKILDKKQVSSINLKNINIEPTSIFDKQKLENMPSSKNKIQRKKSLRKKYIFPYYYFFFDFYFDKIINPQKFFFISNTYFTVYNFMSQIYDISTHIILFKQFNLMNKIFLERIYNEDGFCPIHAFKKINVNDNILMDKINKELQNKKSILFSTNWL